MDVADAWRLPKLDGENGKLKKLPAEATLDTESLRVIARRKRRTRM
jgi:putative transposase